MSLGNEAFLLRSYLAASSSLPLGLGNMVAKAGGSVSGWLLSPDGPFSFFIAPPGENSPQSLMSAETTTTTAAAAAGEMELAGGVFGGFEPSRYIRVFFGGGGVALGMTCFFVSPSSLRDFIDGFKPTSP